MNKKKIISLILAMIAAIACVFTLTSCDCKHKKYISTVVAPTCTEDGYTLHTCKKCGHEYKDSVVTKTGHKPSEVIESDGTTHWNVCTVCKGRANVSEHTYGEGAVKVQPSGTTKGSAVYTCTVCGHETTKALSSGDISHQHAYDYSNMLNDNDSHWYECPTCHERTEVQPHKWDDGKINYVGDTIYDLSVKYVESTTYTCLICGAEKTVDSAETSETDVVYSYVPSMHSYVVTGYVGDKADVEIDRIYKGLPVFAIWAEAFKDNKTLTKITIPNTVLRIAPFAFEGCENLSEVNISDFSSFDIMSKAFYGAGSAADELVVNFNVPDNDKRKLTIGEKAFMGANLKSISLPDGSADIGESAFKDCKSLTSVNFGESVSIGNYAFENCTALAGVSLPAKTTALGEGAFRGDTALTSVKFNVSEVVDQASKKSTDKTDLTEISAEAFLNCSALTSVTIPKGVATIGKYAFASCTSVTSVELGESVNKVNDGAFYNCVKIADLTVEGSFGAVTTSNKIFYDAGKDGSGITLKVKGGASIPENFFMPLNRSNVPNITEIKFVYDHTNDKKVVEFKYNYLPNVKNITVDREIVLTKKVNGTTGTTAVTVTFKGCENLETITLPLEKNIGCYFDSNKYQEGKEPKNYTEITQKLSIDSSTKYYIPSSLKTVNVVGNNVPDSAFSGCKGLDIDISNVNKDESLLIVQVLIGDYAFEGCDLDHITLSDNLGNIGNHAFENCANITDLTKFSNVTGSIGSYAFANTDLTSVEIPSMVYSINSYTFSGCTKLTSVDIHSKVRSIGAYAFKNCSTLTSVTVPNSVTSYGDGVFYNCNSLTTMTLPLHDEKLEFVKLFKYDTTSSSNYSVPSSLTTVTVSSGSIGSYAFNNCDDIRTINLNNTNIIREKAFYGCSSLTSMNIPSTVNSYGIGAFYGCNSLTTMTLPLNGIDREFVKLFKYDTTSSSNDSVPSSLKTVTVSSGKVGNYAFQGAKVTNVDVSKCTSLGNYMFDKCYNLTSVTFPAVSTSSYGYGRYFNESTGNANTNTITINGYTRHIPKNLRNVTIKATNNTTTVGSYAFQGFSMITSVTLDGITTINSYAFDGCSRLTSVTIPNSVTSIGNSAFYGCIGLTSIEFKGTTAQWDSVSKGSGWNSNTGAYTVHCTDGDVQKS